MGKQLLDGQLKRRIDRLPDASTPLSKARETDVLETGDSVDRLRGMWFVLPRNQIRGSQLFVLPLPESAVDCAGTRHRRVDVIATVVRLVASSTPSP